MTFKSPPSPDGSVSDMRFTTPLGARFDPGKSTRKAQAYKFKVGDVVEVRDDPFQPWRRGTVAALQADGRPRVRRADSDVGSAFPFNECRTPLDAIEDDDCMSEVSVARSERLPPTHEEGAATVLYMRLGTASPVTGASFVALLVKAGVVEPGGGICAQIGLERADVSSRLRSTFAERAWRFEILPFLTPSILLCFWLVLLVGALQDTCPISEEDFELGLGTLAAQRAKTCDELCEALLRAL